VHPVLGHYVGPQFGLDPYLPQYWSPSALPSVEELAAAMLQDGEFRALHLGSWLGTTDGQIVSEAVGFAIPLQYGAAYNLAVQGLTLAAEMQRDEGRQKASVFAFLVIAGALLLAGSDA
jgi:hypothetical protein